MFFSAGRLPGAVQGAKARSNCWHDMAWCFACNAKNTFRRAQGGDQREARQSQYPDADGQNLMNSGPWCFASRICGLWSHPKRNLQIIFKARTQSVRAGGGHHSPKITMSAFRKNTRPDWRCVLADIDLRSNAVPVRVHNKNVCALITLIGLTMNLSKRLFDKSVSFDMA